jgi:3-oxoacyl-[acyl-carrier protein] reductase
VIPVVADVGTAAGQAALFAAMPEPDILVNNNGGPPFRDFRELDRAKMLEGVTANMIVAIELIQKVIDPMSKKKFGRIVNITSGSVKAPIDVLGLSNGARSGLTGFVAGVARSNLAERNVTVNGLLPGWFDTDRVRSMAAATAKRDGVSAESIIDARKRGVPARRLGNIEEFGAACAFLCSVHAGYITGQNLLMDGGAYPGTF